LIRHRLVGDKVLGYRLLSCAGYPRARPDGRALTRTRPCRPSSPTPDHGCPTPSGSLLWTAGSPTTTLEAPTPPWVADHRLAD